MRRPLYMELDRLLSVSAFISIIILLPGKPPRVYISFMDDFFLLFFLARWMMVCPPEDAQEHRT